MATYSSSSRTGRSTGGIAIYDDYNDGWTFADRTIPMSSAESIRDRLIKQDHLIETLRMQLEEATLGRTDGKFDGVHEADLVLELIARGYIVHKPLNEEEIE